MSSKSIHKVTCPKCKKEQFIERYNSINDYHKELFPKIVDKTIFDYECESCKEKIHHPYPLLFHKMGIRDIQIGYKIYHIQQTCRSFNPIIVAMKKALEDTGHESKDIFECYEDVDAFSERVASFIN